jgi:predicted Zn-dependent protease
MKNLQKIFILLITLTISSIVMSCENYRNSSKTISIVVIGDFPEKDIQFVKNKLTMFYKCKVNVLHKIEIPKECKVKGINKYQSISIVKFLNKRFDNIDGKVIGLTNVDICTDR